LSAQYQIDYWENNNKRSEGNLIDGKKDSVWIFYHSNGKKWMEGLYKNDQR
jgi:antitoxin component YwqK of YwqJK toxin-antitoxin module